MISCSYWAAGHITAFFKIADQARDLLHKGSLGAGFNIKRGVQATISLSTTPTNQIYFNTVKQTQSSTSITEYVIKELEIIKNKTLPALDINYDFQVPIGAGYGTSASVALVTAFAVNDLLQLGINELTLWQIAHKTEIVNKTGLGDILGLYAKGQFELRIKEGAPGVGDVKTLDFDVSEYDLYTSSFGPLSKKNILTDPAKREKITEIGSECLEHFQTDPSFEKFCSIAREFAKKINLIPSHLWDVLNKLELTMKGSQIMLGESLFFFIPKNVPVPKFSSFELVKEELTGNVLVKVS